MRVRSAVVLFAALNSSTSSTDAAWLWSGEQSEAGGEGAPACHDDSEAAQKLAALMASEKSKPKPARDYVLLLNSSRVSSTQCECGTMPIDESLWRWTRRVSCYRTSIFANEDMRAVNCDHDVMPTLDAQQHPLPYIPSAQGDAENYETAAEHQLLLAAMDEALVKTWDSGYFLRPQRLEILQASLPQYDKGSR